MATPDEIQLQKGTITPAQTEQTGSAKAVSLIESLAAGTPSLPTGTTISPQLQNVQSGELMGTAGVTGTLAAAIPTTAAAPTIAAPGTLAGTQVTAPTAQTAASYTAQQAIGQVPTMTGATGTVTQPMTAATGTITSDATVKGQLESLQNEVQTALSSGNPLPVWARGAAKATEAAMANRGLSASSMAAEALAEGIMNSAIPIAKADADTYKQMIFQNLSNNQQAAITNAQAYLKMDLANLSNAQQANLQNITTRQTFLLSDQAAANAAFQFNATSQNQVNQFYDTLNTNIQTQNAQRSDAIAQFNLAEENKVRALNAKNATAVADANAQRETAISQYNKTLSDARERFNVENQRIIDQSNATWRRSINTANTQAVNAANEANAANLLNLSNFGMSALWQQWRDEASWVNTASQNDLNRNHNLAIAALERTTAFDLQNEAQKAALYGLLGQFGMEIFSEF